MTAPDLTALIAEVEEADRIATPGPWHKCGASGGACSCGLVWVTDDAALTLVHPEFADPGPAQVAVDAQTAVTLRNAAPRIVEALRWCQGEVERLREENARAWATLNLTRPETTAMLDALTAGRDRLARRCEELERENAWMRERFEAHHPSRGSRPDDFTVAEERAFDLDAEVGKLKLDLSDPHTRAVWETVQRAKAEVESWPAWKRGDEPEPAIDAATKETPNG